MRCAEVDMSRRGYEQAAGFRGDEIRDDRVQRPFAGADFIRMTGLEDWRRATCSGPVNTPHPGLSFNVCFSNDARLYAFLAAEAPR